MEYKDPGRYIPIIYLRYSWGSRFGVPRRVPLLKLGNACLGTASHGLGRSLPFCPRRIWAKRGLGVLGSGFRV